jgi:hypothetical protein
MRNRRREDEEDEKDELWTLKRAPERNGQNQQRGKTNRQPGPTEMPLGNLEEFMGEIICTYSIVEFA